MWVTLQPVASPLLAAGPKPCHEVLLSQNRGDVSAVDALARLNAARQVSLPLVGRLEAAVGAHTRQVRNLHALPMEMLDDQQVEFAIAKECGRQLLSVDVVGWWLLASGTTSAIR